MFGMNIVVVVVVVNVSVVIVACELKKRRIMLDCIRVATIIVGEKIRMRWRKKNIIFWERIFELIL